MRVNMHLFLILALVSFNAALFPWNDTGTDVATDEYAHTGLLNETDEDDNRTRTKCVEVVDKIMIPSNASTETVFPVQIGRWILMRCNIDQGGWGCDVKDRRVSKTASGIRNAFDMLKLTVRNDALVVDNVRERCNCADGPRCGLQVHQHQQPQNQHTGCDDRRRGETCFRFEVRCEEYPCIPCISKKPVEEPKKSRYSPWSMFGFGMMAGFLIGCVVSAGAAVCVDATIGGLDESSEKKKTDEKKKSDEPQL